jgi:hypothetical protein
VKISQAEEGGEVAPEKKLKVTESPVTNFSVVRVHLSSSSTLRLATGIIDTTWLFFPAQFPANELFQLTHALKAIKGVGSSLASYLHVLRRISFFSMG